MEKSTVFKTEMSAETPRPTERLVNSKYVAYGTRNMHPQWLYSLVEESSIHQGIINQKTMFINGEGLKSSLNDENLYVNPDESSEIVEGVIRDIEVLGFAIILMERRHGEWMISNCESEKWRFSEDGETFFYSDDWSSGYQREGANGYEVVKHYSGVRHDDKRCVISIINTRKQRLDYFGNHHKITGKVYPSPSYSGGINSIMAHIEMSFYNYAETVNGFVSNTIIQFNDGKIPNAETAKKRVRDVEGMFQNRKSRGGMTIFFNDTKESGMTVDELNRSQNVGKYNDTAKAIAQDINRAHSVQNASLFGMEVEGALGGTSGEEQMVALTKFLKTYASSAQRKITRELNRAFKKLNKLDLNAEFIPFNITSASEVSDVEKAENPSLISEDKFLEKLSKIGREKETDFDSKVLFSRPINDNSADGLSDFFASRNTISFISETQKEVLLMLRNGETFKEISKKLGAKTVYKIIAQLRVLGLLDESRNLTDKAIIEVGGEDDFEVFYEYKEIPGLPALRGESRPICIAIMGMNKYFTREEIDKLGATLGAENLWRYRGGWYHNPVSHKNTRGCRHEWYQVIRRRNDN